MKSFPHSHVNTRTVHGKHFRSMLNNSPRVPSGVHRRLCWPTASALNPPDADFKHQHHAVESHPLALALTSVLWQQSQWRANVREFHHKTLDVTFRNQESRITTRKVTDLPPAAVRAAGENGRRICCRELARRGSDLLADISRLCSGAWADCVAFPTALM